MTTVEIYLRDWYNRNQPVFQIQYNSGKKLESLELHKEVKAALETAFRAGWEACAEETARMMELKP